MYTTKEFEQETLRKGYELEYIRYTPRRTVEYATGKLGEKDIFWMNDGHAFVEDNCAPDYDLFKPDKDGALE